MPHARNVEALAELLFRVEHMDLGIAPPFELLPKARQELYRRRATFLSNRGVLVPSAVAADVQQALDLPGESGAEDRIRALLDEIGRGEGV
ncbi:MAG TPA: hypothetical protein VGR27_10250 [Longimicrobiaceae bacterium]|nr:hypothetical protein [Longimicrobiaceae bacterium]